MIQTIGTDSLPNGDSFFFLFYSNTIKTIVDNLEIRKIKLKRVYRKNCKNNRRNNRTNGSCHTTHGIITLSILITTNQPGQ